MCENGHFPHPQCAWGDMVVSCLGLGRGWRDCVMYVYSGGTFTMFQWIK